jgi:hypothetical protein
MAGVAACLQGAGAPELGLLQQLLQQYASEGASERASESKSLRARKPARSSPAFEQQVGTTGVRDCAFIIHRTLTCLYRAGRRCEQREGAGDGRTGGRAR